MSVAIIVAIVAFVSTIMGATIGAATTYVLAVRRERADRMTDERHHAVDVRRAGRLVDSELMWAAAAANHCIEEKRLGMARTPVLPLPIEVRLKCLETIASDLSNE